MTIEEDTLTRLNEITDEVSARLRKDERRQELLAELAELDGVQHYTRPKFEQGALKPEVVWQDGPYEAQIAHASVELQTFRREREWWATYRAVLAALLPEWRTSDYRRLAREEADYAHGPIEAAAHMRVARGK